MSEQLKPCPFCGGQPNLTFDDYVHDDLMPMPVVECKSCSAWVRAEDWNTRTQSQPVSAQPAGEVPEVVGYRTPFALETDRQQETDEPLMTVAQHARIVAALQARAVVMPECEHDWVDATNKRVSHTDLCMKCGALRSHDDRLNGKGGV
jgi:hypothetical protein